ncbi:MAG: hypothetical protein ACI9CA_000040 [Natronomonas sp.]|jgi:hypothetical protein
MPTTPATDGSDATDPSAPYHERHAPLLPDDRRAALADAHATLRAWTPADQQRLATRLHRLPGAFIASGVLLLAITILHDQFHALGLAALPAIYLCNTLATGLSAATRAAAPGLDGDLPPLDPRDSSPLARGAPGLHALLVARDRHVLGRLVWLPLAPSRSHRRPVAVGAVLAGGPVLATAAHAAGYALPAPLRAAATAVAILLIAATAGYALALQSVARRGA